MKFDVVGVVIIADIKCDIIRESSWFDDHCGLQYKPFSQTSLPCGLERYILLCKIY